MNFVDKVSNVDQSLGSGSLAFSELVVSQVNDWAFLPAVGLIEQLITHMLSSASISYIALRKSAWLFTALPLPPRAIATCSYLAHGESAKTEMSFGV